MENNLSDNPSPSTPEPIQPAPANTMAQKKWYQHKGIMAIIVLVILAAGVCLTYFKYNQTQNIQPIVVNHNTTSNPLPTNSTPTATTTPSNLTTNTVKWHTRQEISDQKLFSGKNPDYCVSTDYTYYDLGTVTSGSQNGSEVLLLDITCNEPEGPGDNWAFFLKNSNGYTLLQKYSDDTTDFKKSATFAIDNNFDISDLDFPKTITDPQNNVQMTRDDLRGKFTGFFDPSNFQYVFTDSKGDPVYQAKGDVIDYTFYKSAPDGMELVYQYTPPFFKPDQDGVLSVYFSPVDLTWNDGQKHDNTYSYNANLECGAGLPEAKVTSADLTLVAQSAQGYKFYEFNNLDNPTVKAAKNLIAQWNKNSSGNPIVFSPDMILFWTDPFGKTVMLVNATWYDACGGKPVIYLYPTKPTQVNVQVSPIDGISKSEPLYDNGWNVLAEPNGTIFANNKNYPYLFWEGGLGPKYQLPDKGFIVQQTQVKQLLSNKLSLIGLNEKEIYDFEQFWLPRMQSSPYYFVTFTVNADMENYAPLSVTPKPDTIIRVLMDYKPLNSYQTVEPLQLPHTERKGFTVVEWGGSLK